jgi:rhodanese-related sulfurtransferase
VVSYITMSIKKENIVNKSHNDSEKNIQYTNDNHKNSNTKNDYIAKSNKITYIIDIREEHELKEMWFISQNNDTKIINIPSRHIKFNIEFIINLVTNENNPVYLFCRSGSRANNIKRKYFAHIENIKVYEGGMKKLERNNNSDKDLRLNIIIEKKQGLLSVNFGIQQYMQFMFLSILAGQFIVLYYNVPFGIQIFNGIIITLILLQIITKSCVLGKVLSYFE